MLPRRIQSGTVVVVIVTARLGETDSTDNLRLQLFVLAQAQSRPEAIPFSVCNDDRALFGLRFVGFDNMIIHRACWR